MPDSRSPVEVIAAQFHGVYESLAPSFGYETKPESAVEWDHVPEQNKALMTATVRYLLAKQIILPGPKR